MKCCIIAALLLLTGFGTGSAFLAPRNKVRGAILRNQEGAKRRPESAAALHAMGSKVSSMSGRPRPPLSPSPSPPNLTTTICSAGLGLTRASFVLSVVGVCLGAAALVLSIINSVRIGRSKKRYHALLLGTTGAASTTDGDDDAATTGRRSGAIQHWDDETGTSSMTKTRDDEEGCGDCPSCDRIRRIKHIIAEGEKEE